MKKKKTAKKTSARKPAAPKKLWHGPPQLRQFLVPIESVKLDDHNARVHDERNLEAIKLSLEKNGQVAAVILYKGKVIAGNARVMVMSGLGWTHVAAIDVQEHFDSETQARAFALMDNKSAELATWDFEAVAETFRRMPNDWFQYTAFAQYEIEPLLEADWSPPTPEQNESQGPDMQTVQMTREQYQGIEVAVQRLRDNENDQSITIGRALELICADFMSGQPPIEETA